MAYFRMVCPDWIPTLPSIADQISGPTTWTTCDCPFQNTEGSPWDQGHYYPHGVSSRDLKMQHRCTTHGKRPSVYQRSGPRRQRELAIINLLYQRIIAYNPNDAYGATLLERARRENERFILFPPESLPSQRYTARVWIARRPPSPTLHTGW